MNSEFPPALEELFGTYIATVRELGDSASARKACSMPVSQLRKFKEQYPLFAELVDEANREFHDTLVIAVRNRVLKGTVEGYIENPITGEVVEKRNYHDTLATNLLRHHPDLKDVKQDGDIQITIRDFSQPQPNQQDTDQ